jgi:preprotein translocase subunit YajC
MFLTLLAASSSGSAGGLAALLPFVLIAVAMYFLLIRPQRRRMQEQRALASAIEEGDEVMTTAGVYGFVTAIEDDVIWLEIAEGVDIRIARAAVSRRVTPADAPTPDAPASGASAPADRAATNGTSTADDAEPAPDAPGEHDPSND